MVPIAIRPATDPRAAMRTTVDGTVDQLWCLTIVEACRWSWNALSTGTMGTPSGNPLTGVSPWSQVINFHAGGGGSLLSVAQLIALGVDAYPNPVGPMWTFYSPAGAMNPDAVKMDAILLAVNLRWTVDPSDIYTYNGAAQNAAGATAAWAAWLAAYSSLAGAKPGEPAGGLIETLADMPFYGLLSRGLVTPAVGGSTRIDLSDSVDGVAYITKYIADMKYWFQAGSADCKFIGLIPPPRAANIFATVYTDTEEECTTKIERAPFQWPYPLIGMPSPPIPSPTISIAAAAYPNTIYFSTTTNKLAYKNSAGVSFDLY